MNRRELLVALPCLALYPAVGHARRPPRGWAATQAANAQLLAQVMSPPKPLLEWQWIVIHHTAAPWATLKGIGRYHKKRFEDPLGIQYHFLIGNGKKAAAGLIMDGRWQHQERAIHLFKPEGAPRAIAICLVGNYETTKRVPRRQLDALVDLTSALVKGCGVPVDRITTHRGVDGRLTQCPGKHFPLKRFKKRVADAVRRLPTGT